MWVLVWIDDVKRRPTPTPSQLVMIQLITLSYFKPNQLFSTRIDFRSKTHFGKIRFQ
jgi:hypothetical protein